MYTPVLRPLSLRQLLTAPVLALGVSQSYAAEPGPSGSSRLEKLTVEEAVVAPMPTLAPKKARPTR